MQRRRPRRTTSVRLAESRRSGRGAARPVKATRRTAQDAALPLSALVDRNYPELRRIAIRELKSARASRTMSPTSLVSESVVRLMRQRSVPAESSHLLGLASILMVQAISDRAKMRRAIKRGKQVQHRPLTSDVQRDRRKDSGDAGHRAVGISPVALHQQLLNAMAGLMRTHPRMMEIVTLHLVLDVPIPRVAELLGVSERTCYRECAEGRRKLAARLDRHPA